VRCMPSWGALKEAILPARLGRMLPGSGIGQGLSRLANLRPALLYPALLGLDLRPARSPELPSVMSAKGRSPRPQSSWLRVFHRRNRISENGVRARSKRNLDETEKKT